jgi:hypothetical protein
MAFDKNNEEWDGSEHDEPWIKWYVQVEMFSRHVSLRHGLTTN